MTVSYKKLWKILIDKDMKKQDLKEEVGDSSGRMKCTLANWTGVAYKIPRTKFEKCKGREDLSQSGVYFLFGISDETGDDVVYIGQAGVRKNKEGILCRLGEHKRDAKMDYWSEAVVFTTSNNSFGPTEISWLENRFCALANEAKRYVIKNGNVPNLGNVTEEKQSELEEFVDYAKIVMGVLRHPIFEPVTGKQSSSDGTVDTENSPMLYCTASGTDAKGRVTSEGFVIFAGSKARLEMSKRCRDYVKRLREKHSSKLDMDGVLMHDVLFDSPSGAVSFLVGQSTNGLTTWKTADGKTLKDIESKEE